MPQYSDPPAGKLQIIDESDSRLVISIPGGGKKARGMGCFAAAWLAITIPISVVFFSVPEENWEGGQAPPLIFLLLFFSIFYAVGFGLLYGWIRMRFMQVLLALEPGRLTIQRTLFGKKKLKRCDLTDDSRAELVESYRSSDVPVYTVRINTAEGDEKFATSLSRDEKKWLASTINRFLGNEDDPNDSLEDDGRPTICVDCGGELLIGQAKRVCAECGRIYTEDDRDPDAAQRASRRNGDDDDDGRITAEPEAVAPYELPDNSRITIEREEPDRLQFSYRVSVPLIIRVPMAGFLLFFCGIWYSFIFSFLYDILTDANMGGERWAFVAFLSLFVFAGLGPLGTLAALFLGRVRVLIDSANLTASIGVGPLRKKKSLACSLIRNVGTGTFGESSTASLSGPKTSIMQGVLVRSTDGPLPLTISSDTTFNNEVAGLVRYQLSQMGYLQQHD